MSLNLFALAVEAAESGNEPPPEVTRWLLSAILKHQRTGESLDRLLGLRGKSQARTLRTIYNIRRRNFYLYKVWLICRKPKKEKDWRYIVRKLHEDLTGADPQLAEAIANAKDAGQPFPKNWKVMREAVFSAQVQLSGETQPQIDMGQLEEKKIEFKQTGT